MKQDKRRSLTRVASVLALVDYCVTLVALAEDSAWADSGETNIFQRTVPWLYSERGSATTNVDRMMLASDLRGACPQGSEADRRLHSGDKLAVSWGVGDIEDNVDLGGLGDSAKTVDTIRWTSHKDAQGGDPKELVTEVTSYTLTGANRGRYIGTEITPATQTGTPNVETALYLYDASTVSGDGNDSDSVASGPVVNQNPKVVIFVDGTSTNLTNGSTPIELGKTYMVKPYSDENKNDEFDVGTGVDVIANYDFRWVPSGSSQQLDTSGSIVNSSFDDNNLVILAINDRVRTNLNGPVRNGKEALSIPINGDGVQGYKLHVIYRHRQRILSSTPARECCFRMFCPTPN